MEFLIVYTREIHPAVIEPEVASPDSVMYPQPVTMQERAAVAADMCTALRLTIPVAIDLLDDPVARAYEGMPDRLYVIGRRGRIVYRGDRGPYGFQPEQMERALLAYLVSEPAALAPAAGDDS